MISVIPSIDTKQPTQHSPTGLIQWLKDNATEKPKSDAPLWSPTTFSSGRREKDAQKVSALVLDFDQAPILGNTTAVGLSYTLHTTHSHSEELHKQRFILALSRPVDARDWKVFFTKCVQLLQISGFDQSCSNVGRFYYLPPANAIWEVNNGRPLPVDEILGGKDTRGPKTEDLTVLRGYFSRARGKFRASLDFALAGTPIASYGDRDNTCNAFAYWLAKQVAPENFSVQAVLSLVHRGLALDGPEPKEHWVNKFVAAFEKARADNKDELADSAKSQNIDEDWGKALQTVQKLTPEGLTVQVLSNNFNVTTILKNSGDYLFRVNDLIGAEELYDDGTWRRLTDADCTNISNWLQEKHKVTTTRQAVYDQIQAFAEHVDPVADYLRGLKWDGVPRVASLLETYMGATPSDIHSLYSRKWLISLVARGLSPGCKVDTVLVLQGKQGIYKSSGLKALTQPWFSDTRLDIRDKDALLRAGGVWCHEFADLSGYTNSKIEDMKNFLSSTEDSFRPPYGRAVITRKRRACYVATTNADTFLSDPTGSRRFWVAKVVRPVDLKAIERDRDQLLAEAVAAYNAGEVWYMKDAAEQKLQEDATSEFEVDVDMTWKEQIKEWWGMRPFDKRPDKLTIKKVSTDILDIPTAQITHAQEVRIGMVLGALGFTKMREYSDEGRVTAYVPGSEFINMPQRGPNGEVKDFKREGRNGTK